MRMRKSLAACFAALALAACSLPGGSSTTSATPGATAPGFTVQGIDGASHSLSDYRGKVVVLNFWATWCIPCRAEMPDLEHEARVHRSDRVVILGMDWKEPAAPIKDFVASLGITYPMLLDADGRVYDTYRVGALPTTFIIDAKGRLVKSRIGIASRGEIESEIGVAGRT
jgi:peroxiredoxin